MGTLESTISPKAPAALPNGQPGRKIVRRYFLDPQGDPVVLPKEIWGSEAARLVSTKLDCRGLYHDVRLRSTESGSEPGIWRSGRQPGWVDLKIFSAFEGVEDKLIERQIRFSLQLSNRLRR